MLLALLLLFPQPLQVALQLRVPLIWHLSVIISSRRRIFFCRRLGFETRHEFPVFVGYFVILG